MTTTVSLMNIHDHTNYNFFLVLRTLKIYPLSKFQYTIQYYKQQSPFLCITFLEFIHFTAGRLAHFDHFHPFCSNFYPLFQQPPIYSLCLWVWVCLFWISHKSVIIQYLFFYLYFYLAQGHLVLSILSQIGKISFFIIAE